MRVIALRLGPTNPRMRFIGFSFLCDQTAAPDQLGPSAGSVSANCINTACGSRLSSRRLREGHPCDARGRQVEDESDGRSAVSGRVLSILAPDSQRSSMALFQPQVLDEDPRNERDAARNAQLAVQAFEMGVDRVGRHTQADRDGGFILVVEHRRQDLRLALGQLKRPREEAPDVV
jgi:hypothetical protein